MTISIHTSSSSYIRINLLELAASILKNFKFGETYSIDMQIDFDNHFITDGGDIRDRYFISKGGYIIDNRYEYETIYEVDSAGIISEEELKIEASLYSDYDYINIITGRINRGLKLIGGKNILLKINGNKININFQLISLNSDEYREYIITYLQQEIGKFNLDYTIDKIELSIKNQIQKLSQYFEATEIYIGDQDLTFHYSKDKSGKGYQGGQNSMEIFDIIMPDDILEYILCLLSVKDVIVSYEKIDSKFKVKTHAINSIIKKNLDSPISFDYQNGIVRLNGSKVGKPLPVGQTAYTFFRVLYDHQNIAIPSSEIMNRAGFKSSSKTDENYLANKLLSVQKILGREFVDTYIQRVNNQFVLWNNP